jgi:hypothetical protein
MEGSTTQDKLFDNEVLLPLYIVYVAVSVGVSHSELILGRCTLLDLEDYSIRRKEMIDADTPTIVRPYLEPK